MSSANPNERSETTARSEGPKKKSLARWLIEELEFLPHSQHVPELRRRLSELAVGGSSTRKNISWRRSGFISRVKRLVECSIDLGRPEPISFLQSLLLQLGDHRFRCEDTIELQSILVDEILLALEGEVRQLQHAGFNAPAANYAQYRGVVDLMAQYLDSIISVRQRHLFLRVLEQLIERGESAYRTPWNVDLLTIREQLDINRAEMTH